jgi:hypothetical protein
MQITTLGIDLAKNVFCLHGCDANGKAVLRKQLVRRQLLSFVANLPPCLVAMEACASAHYWAREIEKLVHQVRLIAPRFVRPYVKANKNDASDAEAISEAASRPSMRFVAIKSAAQLDIQAIHWVLWSAKIFDLWSAKLFRMRASRKMRTFVSGRVRARTAVRATASYSSGRLCEVASSSIQSSSV